MHARLERSERDILSIDCRRRSLQVISLRFSHLDGELVDVVEPPRLVLELDKLFAKKFAELPTQQLYSSLKMNVVLY